VGRAATLLRAVAVAALLSAGPGRAAAPPAEQDLARALAAAKAQGALVLVDVWAPW
jgi:hypothetical protein